MRRYGAAIAWVLLVAVVTYGFWHLEQIDKSRAAGRTNVCSALTAISRQFAADGHPLPSLDTVIVNLHCPKG